MKRTHQLFSIVALILFLSGCGEDKELYRAAIRSEAERFRSANQLNTHYEIEDIEISDLKFERIDKNKTFYSAIVTYLPVKKNTYYIVSYSEPEGINPSYNIKNFDWEACATDYRIFTDQKLLSSFMDWIKGLLFTSRDVVTKIDIRENMSYFQYKVTGQRWINTPGYNGIDASMSALSREMNIFDNKHLSPKTSYFEKDNNGMFKPDARTYIKQYPKTCQFCEDFTEVYRDALKLLSHDRSFMRSTAKQISDFANGGNPPQQILDMSVELGRQSESRKEEYLEEKKKLAKELSAKFTELNEIMRKSLRMELNAPVLE